MKTLHLFAILSLVFCTLVLEYPLVSAQVSIIKPGFLPDYFCQESMGHESYDIENSTGFAGVYYLYYGHMLVHDYVLPPGQNATFLYVEHGDSYPIYENFQFFHDNEQESHPGVHVKLNQINMTQGYSFTKIIISADKDAKQGAYWVIFPPGYCSGGSIILLTIGNSLELTPQTGTLKAHVENHESDYVVVINSVPYTLSNLVFSDYANNVLQNYTIMIDPDGNSARWFTPMKNGNYTATITSTVGNVSMSFVVYGLNELPQKERQNDIIMSPLAQFKSGIAAKDVKCENSLQLVIKAEDNSPACVHTSGMARMVRQGWWTWNEKVGNTIVNTLDKKPFAIKDCAIPETVSSIVGTKGFVKDDLPVNGITYPGENMTGLVGQIIQFSIKPNSEGYITFTYDFNQYPGSNCKVTTKDAMTYFNMVRKNAPNSNTMGSNNVGSNTTMSDFQISPDIFQIDKTRILTDSPLVGDSGDIQVKLINVEDLNDHVVKVTYQIISKPTSQLGKSYLLSFWWHSGIGITVGNDLYNGTAFSGPRFG